MSELETADFVVRFAAAQAHRDDRWRYRPDDWDMRSYRESPDDRYRTDRDDRYRAIPPDPIEIGEGFDGDPDEDESYCDSYYSPLSCDYITDDCN